MGRARERDHAIAQPRSTEEDTTDTDDDVRKDVKGEGTAPEVRRKEEKPKRSVKRRTIGLKELVNAQILRPGQGVISCEYKGNKLVGNLMDDGKLGLDGTDQLWDSPSSFSVMLKRRITPGRKADDGWKSLKYHGVLLELLKKRYFDGLGPLDEAAPTASGKLLGGLGAAQGQRASKRKAGDAEPGAGGADAAACGPSADASPEAAAGAAADAGAPAGGRWAVVGGRSPRSKMARRAPTVADGTQQQAEVPSIECSRGESAGSDSYDAEGELLKVLGLNERARRQPFKPPEMRSSSDGKEAVGVDQGRPPFPLAVRHLAGAPMNAPGEAAAEFASSGRRSSGEASPAARGSSAGGGGAGNGGGGSGAGGGEEPNSSGRPRRSARIPQRKSGGMGMDSEHSMVQCTGYQGRPGDGKAGSQPFQIFVHPRVELLMDLHSHLHLNEVIGLLAGKFNVRRRTLHIFSAFPVREMDTEEARINVEMDPADQVRVRGEMEACGWDPIGWYHSHPTFPAIPSVIDCFNQYNQQCAHRWSLGQEPYIAAIVAPYDRRLPGTRSMISWFYVDHPTDLGPLAADQNPLEVGCRPFELKVESMLDPNNSSFNIVREFDTVLSWYRRSKHRVALEEPWKDGYNKLGKMVASTASRLPARISHDVRVQYGRILEKLVLQRWFSAKAMADAPPPCASPPRRPGRPRKHPLPSATAAAASIAGVKPAAGAALPLATPRPPPGSLGGGSEWQQPPQPVSHGLKLRLTGLSSSSPIVAAVSRPDGSSLGSLGLVGSAPQLSAAPPPPPLPSTVPSPISLAAAAVAASGLAAAGLVAPAPQPAAAGAGSAANGTSPAVGAATPASLPSSQAPSQTTQQAADGVSAQ